MSSTIVVEDGTIVAGANAYIDAAGVRAYGSLRGVSLPAIAEDGSDSLEPLIIRATDYLESLNYIYRKATKTQPLSWPRVNVPYLFDYGIWSEVECAQYIMPDCLAKAQAQLVIEQSVNGIDLMPSTVGGTQFVTREKVDCIETSYSERLGTLSSPTMPRVNALLRTVVVRGSGNIPTVRA